MANSRIYVQSSIKTAFIEQFSKLASSRSLGNPTKSEVNHGAQADQTQYETVQRYIKLGKQDANAPSQTSKSADGPLLVEPVILTDQPEDSPVVKEEIFGPVVVINTFETEDESRRRTTRIRPVRCVSQPFLSNSIAQQLTPHSLYTKDLERAIRVSKRLVSGMVGVNCTSPTGCWDLPFGGWKSSGLGRESLLESLAEYMEVKSVYIRCARL
jgi:aldehyde dehydrogenase (NAD+)